MKDLDPINIDAITESWKYKLISTLVDRDDFLVDVYNARKENYIYNLWIGSS